MANNKIIYGNQTLIDLTGDTVSTDNLLSGATAHDRSGASIVGSVTVPSDLNDLSDVDISSATNGQALIYNSNDSEWQNTNIDAVPKSTGGTFEGNVTVDTANGTAGVVGESIITAGNNTLMSAADNSKGILRLYSRGSKYVDICPPSDSAINDNRTLTIPDKSGTIATTDDIVQSDWNESSSSSKSFINNKPDVNLVSQTVETDSNQNYRILLSDNTAGNKGTIKSTAAIVNINAPSQSVVSGKYTTRAIFQNIAAEANDYNEARLELGNNKAVSAGTDSFGNLRIYDKNQYYADINEVSTGLTDNRTLSIPDKSGTIATTADMPTDFVSKASGGTFSGNIVIDRANGTTTSEGISQLSLGNNKGSTTAGNSSARLIFYGPTASVYSDIKASNVTTTRHLELPNKGGTFALVGDDISTFNNDSGYVTTDNKVRQLNTTTSADYRVILSYGANSSDVTNRVHKSDNLTFNPSTEVLTIGGTASFKSTQTQELKISTNVGGGSEQYDLFFGVRNNMWNLAPVQNKQLQLGSSSYRWNEIFAANATINTSDRKEKKDIEPLDENARDFIMALNPVSYKFIDGKSGRTHYGMIAQDVEEEMASLGMTDKDFAGFCKDQKMEEYETLGDDNVTVKRQRPVENEYNYGLRYEEFIAPLIKTVQLQQQEIEQLKQEIRLLKGE